MAFLRRILRQTHAGGMKVEVPVNTAELKVVQAIKSKEILWFAIGVAQTRDKGRDIQARADQTSGGARYRDTDVRQLEWQFFWNRDLMSKFVSKDELAALLFGATSLAAGNKVRGKTTPVTEDTMKEGLGQITRNYVSWSRDEMSSFVEGLGAPKETREQRGQR